MAGLMETLGMSSTAEPSSDKPMQGGGKHRGLSKRLSAALESGNDSRVYAILKDVIEDCLDERGVGGEESEY